LAYGKNTGALEKFESLIFSGFTSNSEILPSTFDGMDQIAKTGEQYLQ